MKRVAWVGLVGLVLSSVACSSAAPKVAKSPVKEPVPARTVKKPPVIVQTPEKQPGQEAPKPPPKDLVVLQSSPERTVLAADSASDLIVRVRLSAESIPSAKRPPLNLALVVDTSGSMKGDPIAQARKACKTLLGKLEDGDRLSIVTFGSKAQLLLPSTKIDDDELDEIEEKIASMTARGTTNMSDGLAWGLNEVSKNSNKDLIHRIVLLGDGVPNDAGRTLGTASSALHKHVPITSLGLGAEFDETVMNQVAQRSGGTFHFIDEGVQVAAVFEKEVMRLSRVVAKNGFLEITPGPGVTVQRALGMPLMKHGRKLRLHIGQLSEGQVRDVMVQVSVDARADGANIELVDATFRYVDAAQGQGNRELDDFVALTASKNADDIAEGRNAAVEHAALRIRVADMFVRAIAQARNGDVKGARKLLRDAEKIARDGAKRFDDEELTKKVGEARELQKTVVKLAPKPVRPRWPQSSLGHARSGIPSPRPAPMPKPEALGLRRTHGAAVKTINGF